MKKIICIALLMSVLSAKAAASLQQLLDCSDDHTVAQFCEFVEVPEDERQSFITFYETQVKKHQRIKSAARRQSRAQKTRDSGRSALEVELPDCYTQLTALEAKTNKCKSPQACVAQNARFFLTRYSAWHDYKKSQAQSQAGLWAKVKGLARGGSQRVAQWFGRSEPVKVATK